MSKNQTYREAAISIQEVLIPIKLYSEWRQDTRFALNAKGGIIRHPLISLKGEKGYIRDFRTWAEEVFKNKPQLLKRYITRSYKEGELIHVMDMDYTIRISSLKTFKIMNSEIHIPCNASDTYDRESLKKIISKLFVKKYTAQIKDRVHYWNDTFFKSEINKITLRYTQSRWGSCSTKKNISLSSKLLLAPKEVLDYVIVHELAHTYEMNHSKKFWDKVASVMPDYNIYEKMLKEVGAEWDF